MKELDIKQIEGMKFILKYYDTLREQKSEECALRECYRKIQELEG